MNFDGWITDKGKFLREEFNHKETLIRHGYNLDSSDAAIKAGFTRLVDEGSVLYAEVWFTHYRVAREWLERNASDRTVEISILNHAAARVFRVGGRL